MEFKTGRWYYCSYPGYYEIYKVKRINGRSSIDIHQGCSSANGEENWVSASVHQEFQANPIEISERLAKKLTILWSKCEN